MQQNLLLFSQLVREDLAKSMAELTTGTGRNIADRMDSPKQASPQWLQMVFGVWVSR